MTVPSHNLYDFIHEVTEKQYWLMYFYHWGNKDFDNLVDHYDPATNRLYYGTHGLNPNAIVAKKFLPDELLNYTTVRNFQPILLCHDQEPLHFDLYADHSENMKNFNRNNAVVNYPVENQNLRSRHVWSWQKKWI